MRTRSLFRRARWLTRWSLVLVAVASFALWATSRWGMIGFDIAWLNNQTMFLVRYSRAEYWGTGIRAAWPGMTVTRAPRVYMSWQPVAQPAWWWTMQPRWKGQTAKWILPLWSVFIASTLSAAGMRAMERKWMRRPGAFCPRCDYDWAGLDQMRPCPECGLERGMTTPPPATLGP